MTYVHRSIRDSMDREFTALFAARDKSWKQMLGRVAIAETPSHAFCTGDGVRVTYDGCTSQDLLKARCVSTVQAKFCPPADAIYHRMQEGAQQDGIDFVSRLRSGGMYYAGNYANKQLANWLKPGMADLMTSNVFQIYRTPEWEQLRPGLLDVIDDEFDSALRLLDRITDYDTAEYYVIGNKPPDTGVGYSKFWKTRAELAKALAKGEAQRVLEHDLLVAKEGQKALWQRWPYQGTEIFGFLGYTGSYHVSRSDADVVSVEDLGEGRMIWTIETAVRAANITPTSWASNSHAMPRSEQRQKMLQNNPLGYIPPMTVDVLRKVWLGCPITAPFVHEADLVTIDGDWGYQWPRPSCVGGEDDWTLVRPAEKYKLGADQSIGVGGFTRGVTGVITPEWSSGRGATRRGYQRFVDWVVSTFMRKMSVDFMGMSNGDDQVIHVSPKDIPVVMNSELAPYLRTKGSDKNWVFRWGKTCRYRSPDEVEVVTLPRIIKTSTTASVLQKGTLTADLLNFRPGETKVLPLQPEALESASRTWEIAPDVFYMSGSPKEIGEKMATSSYQDALRDAILAGAIDQNTALYVGDLEKIEDEMNAPDYRRRYI